MKIYRERNTLPSTIIIGVDPWVFNKNNGCLKWHWFGQGYYSKFTGSSARNLFDLQVRPQDFIPFSYQQLVSISYFQAGLHVLMSSDGHFFSKQQWFSSARQKLNAEQSILPDGSRTWSKSQRESSLSEVRKQIQEETQEARNISGFSSNWIKN